MDILKLTALELGEKIRKKELAVREAVDAVLVRAEAAEPVINSYVTLDREGAYRQVEEIQRKMSVHTTLSSMEWDGKRINLLDTPGKGDFIGEDSTAFRAKEAALMVGEGREDDEIEEVKIG